MTERGGEGRLSSEDSQESISEALSVHRLTCERLGEAADLLARCFHDNLNFVDLIPDERARSRVLPRMFAAGLREALGSGHVYAATRGGATT